MEFRGEDFIKKVQIKQEKETLKQRLNVLEEQDSITTPTKQHNFNETLIDLPEQELGDILLSPEEETTDKKKYIILGLVLVVLFLITIIIIRLATSPDENNNDSFVDKKETISQDKVLNDENIEQQYQKIINQKLKKLQDEKNAKLKDEESLNIKKTQKEEIVTTKQIDIQKEIQTKEIKKELLTLKEEPKQTLKKETKAVIKPEVKKVIKKAEPIKKSETNASWPVKKQTLREPSVTDFTRAPTADKLVTKKSVDKTQVANVSTGYFVQVGAFSNPPSAQYLANIKKAGYTYILHDITIKEKRFTKVLIGPYPNNSTASKDLDQIKIKLSLKSAYILKL